MAKNRTYEGVFNALQKISKEENIDFGLDGYTADTFKQKYFTGPGNIENLYNKLNKITEEQDIDFGQGTRDEWLASFGYKRSADEGKYETLGGTRVGGKANVDKYNASKPKPQPKPTQSPLASPVPAPEDEGADDPVLGTPWGTEGSATGKSKTYKPFAPGQVRTNEKMNGTDLGVPYRPDYQMTAAARDEAYRQNDFAVKQVQKIRRENTRRNQPVVDTGNPDVNKSVIKTQGQWEDELQQGANRISSSVVAPAVDNAIKEFDKKAEEIWGKYNEQSKYVDSASPMSIEITRQANQAKDPDKILNFLQQQMEDLYKNKDFAEEVGKEADKMGMDRSEYIEKVIKPQIQSDLSSHLTDTLVKREMPKSTVEYILNGLGNSIAGMLYNTITESKGQRNIKNQAAAMTEEGDNPYYTPGTGAKLAQMGVSFAADAPFFGIYGRVSGQVAKNMAEREIQKLVGKGLSEGAARSIVGSALENSVGARMKNYIMQHVVSSSMTLGAYNATSESARQLRDQDFNPGQLAKSTLEGLATGAAFGATGGAVQALSQPLSGFARVGAKVGGFAVEAETLYTTEELAKMAEGEEAFTNPFEGSLEAMEKLGVMKLSGGHLLGKAVETVGNIKNKGITQAAGEAVGGLLGRQRTGVEFTPEEKSYIRDTLEGKDLVESLTNMHPDMAVEEVNGKKKFTKEGEQQRRVLADNYDRFMSNPEIPSTLKSKVAKMFGGIYRPGLETGATITENEDGSVILKTRDQDGNCVRDLKFDTYEQANAWQQQNMTEFSRNDATNMWNNASLQTRQNIIDVVKGDITGTQLIADRMIQTGGMKQKRLQRELAKIEELRQQFEGREMTDEEVRNYIQMVIKDGDDAVFNQMYQIIRDNAYPADELNTKRNYWEGTQMSDMDRHYAQVDAQLAEEKLALLGQEFADEVIGAADYPDEKMAELATRTDVTKEQLEAALDYYNKTAKVNGLMDQALKNVDDQVNAANAQVQKNTHPDTGRMIQATAQGHNYYITAGHFQLTPDGRLQPTDNSGMVILRDMETGEIKVISPNDVTVTGITDPARLMEYNDSMDGLRGELMKQADDSIQLNPETPAEAANGDIYIGSDGKQYMAMQIQDEAGNSVWAKIAIDKDGNPVGNPMPFDMEEYRKAKSDQIDLAEMPQEAVVDQMEAVIEQNPSENAQTGENYAQKSPENIQSSDLDNAGAEASAANGTGAYEAPAPALSRIPVDEKGRKIYEQAKPEDTLAELTEKYGEEKAQQMISQIAEGATKELEKLQKTDTSTITDMADLEAHEDKVAAARAKVDYWNTISENIKNKNAKKVWNNLENPEKITNFATDPESQTQWVDEHFDEIVDSYSRTHGNKLDPDDVRKAFTGIGYTGKNVDEFRKNEVRLVRAIYEKMLNDAVKSGNKSITLLTGAGGAGKSTATDQIDLSDRGVVYDSALNSFQNLERAILKAKNAGMTDIQVIAVYNDALQSFSNTLKRGLETERFLPIGYFTKAFQNNQGKIAELRRRYPDVDIMCFDNSGNKSAERPNGGRVSVEEAEKWDYTLDEEKFNELLKLIEDGINKGRFREDQLASIGRGLRDASRLVGAVTPATEARVGQLMGRISGEDVGDMRPGISREQRESGRGDMATPADGAVQGSSDQRRIEEEPGKKPGSSDDDGPEPPAAGAAAGGSGLGQSQQHASASGGSGASATGGAGNGSASTRSELSPAQVKAYQKVVEANIGRTFTFNYGNGTKSVLKVQRIDHNGNAVITRQDYNAQGHPIGSPVEERYDFRKVGKVITENTWKKDLDTDEKLRRKYKFDKFKKGDVPVIDVLTDDEKQQLLHAYERGDKEAVGNLTGDFIESHREDIILRGRALRNEKVDKVMARSGRGERLRGVREQYNGYPDAESYLSDESMQPQTIEEYVADALGDVPKMGNGFLAYTSYDKGGNTIVGLKDETGFGSRGFGGDTKGFNPWLAPKGQGISLKQFAESIHESLPEGLKQQYSDQDLRNIIWNVLTSAEKPTDIANYILNNRIEQAETSMRRMEEDMIDDAPTFQKVYGGNSFASRLQRGKESVNTEPTEAQKEAGNYKKGHISFGGYDFTIENPEGSMRRGTDASGKQWEQKMNNTYGYILGKYGKDGDHLDMFINDTADLDNWNGTVYVVDQVDPKTGKWDEHKVLYGFDSLADAKKAYLSNYEEGWKGLGKITGVTKEGFDMWLDSSKRKMKEFADHSIAKEHMVESEHTGFDPALKQLNTRGISINDPDLMKEYGLKDLVLSKTGDHVTLNKIVVENQGEGNGTRFMEDLARLADEKGWTLALTPSGGFGAKSIKRLKDFYKRFGFADNKGRNADFYTRESMVRRPKETVGANTPERQEQALRDAVVEHLRSKGIEVSTDWKLGQKILDDYNGGGKLSASKKRALDTVVPRDNSPFKATAVSSADGAKVLKDLETLAKKSENLSIRGKNSFIGDVADALGAQMKGSKSKYAKFETDDGTEVIIRLADHNATVSQFDYKGEDNGISIVISRKPNKGITNDGDARLVEVFYPDKALKKAEGNPYAEIVKSISNALHTGDYKDTTGLAEREEVNADEIKQHKTKFFKTGDGYAYGYTMGGKIYVDPRIATSETPIHEYGHLYCAMKRQTDPEGWNNWKQVMFGDKLVQPIIDKVRRDYPELEGKEDDFAEEIITQFSGKRGSERLREIAEEVAKEKGGIFGKAEAVTAMQRLKSILNRFWEGVAKMMGWKYKNANQIADRIMADMLNGVDPTRMAKDTRRLRPQAEMLKQVQLDMILKNNPANDADMPGHTWIRSIEDIKSFKEALEYDGLSADENVTPDFTAEMVKDALKNGVVTVYSSKPIKNGIFVTPSKMEAQNYAGDGKVYSKEVPLSDVAWIDAIQGQYAEVSEMPRSQKVDYTSKEEIEKTKTIFDAAKNLFGTTRDVREAGYILPDGTMPDFSGRHLMDPGSDTSFLRGRRTTDHREVQSLAYEKDGETKTGIETDMPDFIRRGAIRIDDNAGNINLATKPTAKQKSILRQLIARNDGYVQVDFGDGWDSDHYVEYDEAKPSKVLADIDRYFDEGIKPDGGPKFQMVGRSGAAEADRAERKGDRAWNLKLAEEAEKAGEDSHAIKFATGWERGADGQWRYEIPDADRDILSIYQNEFKNVEKEYQEKKKELDDLTSEWDKQGEKLLSQIEPDGKGMSRDEFNKRLEPISKKVKEMRNEVEHLEKLRENLSPILKLGDLLGDDNELFKYYPEMKKMQVMFDKNMQDGVSGSFDGSNISINAREAERFGDHELDNENIYGTLLHEVQHAIQEIEGFAQGGSLQTSTTEAGINAIIAKKEAKRDRIKTELDANNKILSDPENLKMSAELEGKTEKEVRDQLTETVDQQAAEYDTLGLQIDRLRHTKAPSMTDARDLYHRLAGEVEARNVTSRMNMTDTERMTHTAEETEDTPRNDQVIIMGDQENEQKSSAEAPKFQKVEDDTHSENFKNFFGDWEKDPENSSKIVDGRGEPMVVYHQTANDFTVFDPRHKGSGTNDYQLPFGIFMKPTARNIGLGGEKQMPLYANIRKPLRVENRQVLSALLKSKVEGYKEALAEYDRIDKEYAKKFDEAEKFDHERNVENWNKWKSGEMTEQEYQDAISDTAENVVNEWKEAQNKPISEMKELLDDYFRNSEYDGIWITKDEGSLGRSTETIIAFEPNQVKSATNNTGAYDPNNPDIRFQKVEKPVFISNAERAVDGIKQDKATPEQWLKMIEKAGGLKAGEDKWIGLSDWLNSQKDKKSITKQDVMDYIRQNQIQIEETNYSEGREIFDEIERRYPGFEKAYYVEADDFDGTPSYSIRDLNAAVDLYNNHHPENYRIDVDDKGNITDDQYDDLINYAAELFELGSKSAEVRGIDPTRLNYTTNGLDNKREIALVVPSIDPYRQDDTIHFGDAGEGRAVAWIRFGDTTDADGNKVLVIDEIQSKRHQDAREKGYNNPNAYSKAKIGEYRNSKYEETVKEADIIGENGRVIGTMFKEDGGYSAMSQDGTHMTSSRATEEEALKALDSFDLTGGGVPDAPFEKNWHELAMKRMLRYAAENGYDKIAWTTGAQQSERYNIGNVVEKIISYDYPAIEDPDGRNSKKIEVRLRDGNTMTMRIDQNGKVIEGRSDTEGKQLSDVVGKDLAKRIINGDGKDGTIFDANRDLPAKVIDGEGLRIGSDGMQGFYDQILPRFMDKYGKKWGVKTGEIELPNLEKNAQVMWSVDVTPEMKESVMQGQPMFQRVGNPEPELTPEERQYWNQWDAAMKKWKERNAIPANQTQAPEKPKYQQGENALDYAQKLVQWNRMKSLWQTAPKLEDYRQVRDDKDIVEAARENEQRYPDSPSAKMRRVASEMMRIRHAMSRQKAYDKATVKAVTDFAQDFMKLGFGDNLSRGEMERMLSSVKNATGAKDIKKSVDNIMNILIDNHLRNLDQRVQKLSSTKELSKTAQGVEKQGRLELKGQRMIQAFRDAREKRMTLDQISQRMADVADKMNRNDEEAPMWEQEYEGLSIARQYVENIEGSREEWADLDTLYKDAVKDYKNSGRSYKDQQEYLESLEQAMQENKIERIGYFGDIIGRLEGNIAESMQGAKEFVEREKQRTKRIQDMANADLNNVSTRSSRKETKTDRLLQNDLVRLVLSPLGTFEQFLKQFGSRDSRGVGYLYEYYMRGFMDAQNNAYAGEVKAREEMDAKAREIFGGKVKHWSDLYDISRQPGIDVEYIDGGDTVKENLTQGNMLYIYMANKMTDGKMKLRAMGITEEQVEQLKEKIDPRLVQLGDWLQSEYLVNKRVEYNKVYERMFGAPMAAIENYFPIKVNRDASYQDAEKYMMNKEGDKLPSSITGSIIKRRRNALPLDILHTDALDVAMEHIQDMEHWKAQAEWNRDVKDLLSYTAFRNKVKNMKTIYGSGSQLWNDFFDAATIATGDYVPKRGAADKALTNIAKGITGAKINFRIYTAFKQLQSIQAFVTDVPVKDIAKAMMPQNYFYNNFKWAKENIPVFRKRWESRQIGDTRLMDDPTDWKIWKKKWMQEISKYGMYSNAAIDALTCAAGAKATYDSKYSKYKEIGASDDVAHKRALQDAAIAYNLTQQSSEGAFVSAIQKDRTLTANALTVFRNGPFSYTRQAVDALRNLKHLTQKGYKEDSIRFTAQKLRDELGVDEAQAEKAAELQYAHTARHEFVKALNMMFGITITWNLLQSVPYLIFGDDGSHIDAAKDVFKGNFRKAYDEFSGSTKGQMWADAVAKGIAGGPVEGLAAGNIWSDMMGRALSEKTRTTFREQGLGAAFDEALKQAGDYEVNPLPMMADIQSMIEKMGYDKYAAAQDLFNIIAQSYTGVNPQTFTDAWNAAMDYGNPSWMPFTDASKGNEDLANSKEIALFIMRVLNAPTSSWRNKYIDELGMNAEDAKKLPYEEMAKRYANYKHWKDAPIMGWLRSDETRQEKMDKIQKQFDDAVMERMQRLTDDELKYNVARSESVEERRKYAKIISNRLGLTPGETSKKQDEKKWYQEVYQENMQYDDIREDETLATKYREYREKDNKDKTKKEVKKLLDKIRKEKKQFDTNGDDEANEKIMQNIRKWRKEALEILMRAEAE